MSSSIMLDRTQLLTHLENLTHPNNTIRESSESQLTQLFQTSSPSLIIQEFLQFVNDLTLSLTIRQTVLLTMKKVVPMYWSAAFDSFIGEEAINQQVKQQTRDQLLTLVFNTDDSKIRSSAIYVIVQIAAVDYPDEWPSLIQTLYKALQPETGSNSQGRYIGALALLLDLFDDLITDQQFFGKDGEMGLGAMTMQHCLRMINDETNVSDEVRVEAVKVYRTCVFRLQNHPVLSTSFDEEDASESDVNVLNEIKRELESFIGLTCDIITNRRSLDAHNLIYRTTLYNIAFVVLSEFPEDFFPEHLKKTFNTVVVTDIVELNPEYLSIGVNESATPFNIHSSDPHIAFSNVVINIHIEMYQCLSALNLDVPLNECEQLQSLLHSTVCCLLVPESYRVEYLSDFNPYVTEEFGFATDFSVRNAVTEYLGELSEKDMDVCFEYLVGQLRTVSDSSEKEALLFFMDLVFRHMGNLTSITADSITELLQFLAGLLSDEDALVRSRAILIIPSFFQKFESLLGAEQVINFGEKLYSECLRVALNDEGLVKVAVLLATLTYRDFLDFKQLPEEIQTVLFDLIESVLEEADEDTPSLLVEVVIASLDITKSSRRALELILKSAAKDTSNIQLVSEVEDAIVSLLKDIDLQTYLAYLQIALPELLATISMSEDGKFTPQLSLAVSLLTSFMFNAPDKTIPDSVFSLVQPVIMELLIKPSTDDQILQYASETFVTMLQNASENASIDHVKVLGILERFLDPELSDSAALNVGSLIVTIIDKINSQQSAETTQLIQQILKATTARLLQAKELKTVENLLSVITYLLTNSNDNISDALDFLASVSSLQQILQIWFDHFPTLRGASKIHENVIALTKLYQSDFHFSQMQVNGDQLLTNVDPDVIITRSMRAKLQYAKVSVRCKVIKLLIGELKSQIQSNEKYQGIEDVVTAVNAEEEDGEWEDFEEIGNDYSKLQSYVEGDEHGEDDGEPDGGDDENVKIQQLLLNFFKTVARDDINGFKQIFETELNEDDRSVLMQNIV
ncbi:hypothetical protein WICPIJ_008988 [Wickerhamomyces pijperi]|uniref:Importin N-terminal domain-containing protein n=1 Tax=Wickerhamomyces pijperi TaxID=599730 RepID=A0A9P8PS21_WICPI|nr:hypothetical protein WICPIJ_008988 [Wickerhamomyces pijperi]